MERRFDTRRKDEYEKKRFEFSVWDQLETKINQVQISPISKFFYLMELLVPKKRLLIKGKIGYGLHLRATLGLSLY